VKEYDMKEGSETSLLCLLMQLHKRKKRWRTEEFYDLLSKS